MAHDHASAKASSSGWQQTPTRSGPQFQPVPPHQAPPSQRRQATPLPEITLSPENYQIDLANPLASMYGHRPPPVQAQRADVVDETAAPEPDFAVANPLALMYGHPPIPLQPKLTVGAVGDKYEQEADQVAAQVVEHINSPNASQSVAISGQVGVQRETALEEEEELQMKPLLQRQAMPEEEEELQMQPMEPLQREAMPEEDEEQRTSVGAEGGVVTADVEGEINAARGGGQSLTPDLQTQMGQAMEADFSGVRVHTDTQADALNRSVGSRAFTTGQDVFFKQGEYQPGNRDGQELIAHELTHVIQQNVENSKVQPAQSRHLEINRSPAHIHQSSDHSVAEKAEAQPFGVSTQVMGIQNATTHPPIQHKAPLVGHRTKSMSSDTAVMQGNVIQRSYLVDKDNTHWIADTTRDKAGRGKLLEIDKLLNLYRNGPDHNERRALLKQLIERIGKYINREKKTPLFQLRVNALTELKKEAIAALSSFQKSVGFGQDTEIKDTKNGKIKPGKEGVYNPRVKTVSEVSSKDENSFESSHEEEYESERKDLSGEKDNLDQADFKSKEKQDSVPFEEVINQEEKGSSEEDKSLSYDQSDADAEEISIESEEEKIVEDKYTQGNKDDSQSANNTAKDNDSRLDPGVNNQTQSTLNIARNMYLCGHGTYDLKAMIQQMLANKYQKASSQDKPVSEKKGGHFRVPENTTVTFYTLHARTMDGRDALSLLDGTYTGAPEVVYYPGDLCPNTTLKPENSEKEYDQNIKFAEKARERGGHGMMQIPVGGTPESLESKIAQGGPGYNYVWTCCFQFTGLKKSKTVENTGLNTTQFLPGHTTRHKPDALDNSFLNPRKVEGQLADLIQFENEFGSLALWESEVYRQPIKNTFLEMKGWIELAEVVNPNKVNQKDALIGLTFTLDKDELQILHEQYMSQYVVLVPYSVIREECERKKYECPEYATTEFLKTLGGKRVLIRNADSKATASNIIKLVHTSEEIKSKTLEEQREGYEADLKGYKKRLFKWEEAQKKWEVEQANNAQTTSSEPQRSELSPPKKPTQPIKPQEISFVPLEFLD